MVSIKRYPLTAATKARPIPVLPLVGSTIVSPGCNRPSCSATSIMFKQIRSFTLPPGLNDSSFAHTPASSVPGNRRSCTTGVIPIRVVNDRVTWHGSDIVKFSVRTAPQMRTLRQSVIGIWRCYPGKGGKSTKARSRILILFPGSLGDFLCFLPTLQFIRAVNPGCQIEIVARGDGLAIALGLSEVTRTLSLESGLFAKLFSPHVSLAPNEERFFTSVDEIFSWFG